MKYLFIFILTINLFSCTQEKKVNKKHQNTTEEVSGLRNKTEEVIGLRNETGSYC